MTKSLDLARKLNSELLEEDLIKEFKLYESMMNDHPEIKEAEEALKDLQKELLNAKVHHDENYDVLSSKYKKAYNEFVNHPLVVNYLGLKEDVNSLVLEVENLINNGLTLDIDLSR